MLVSDAHTSSVDDTPTLSDDCEDTTDETTFETTDDTTDETGESDDAKFL